MDVSAIQTPPGKGPGEHTTSDLQDSARPFSQLLADHIDRIDAAQQTPPDGGTPQGDAPLSQPALLGGALAEDAGQEHAESGGPAGGVTGLLTETIQASQQGSIGNDLVSTAPTSDGEGAGGPSPAVPAPLVAARLKDALANGQILMVESKASGAVPALADVNGPASALPADSRTGLSARTALIGTMNLLAADRVLLQPGTASAATQAPIVMLDAQSPVSLTPEASGRSTTAQTMVFAGIMESSDLLKFSNENDSTEAREDARKEPSRPIDANGPKLVVAPAASPFLAQISPTATRSPVAPGAVGDMAAVAPVSSSVRFEVNPGDLGLVRVHVSIVNQTVYANVVTERVEMQEWLIKGSDRLEAGLAAQGLDVGQFRVDVQSQGREAADRGWATWPQQETPPDQAFRTSDEAVIEVPSDSQNLDSEYLHVNLFA